MWRKASAAVLLVLATGVVYWPLAEARFLNFDDPVYVTNNPEVLRGLSLRGIAWAFTTAHACFWHPLTWLSHMLDCTLFGQRSFGHHLVSVLLHAANALLLLGVLNRMTGAYWRSVLVAGLFALHPLHVESVAWIAERKDVLSTFFLLLTLWAYAGYVEQRRARSPQPKGKEQNPTGLVRKAEVSLAGGQGRSGLRTPARESPGSPVRAPRSAFWYVVTLVFFTLGLMSKPMLVTLPFMLLLLDFWPLGRLARNDAPSCSPASPWRGLVVEKWPFFVLAGLFCGLTFFTESKGGALASTEQVPLLSRSLNAIVSYAVYLVKTLVPVDLAVTYPLRHTWPAWEVALAAVVLAGGSLWALAALRKRPYQFVGWFWFVGTMVPVIGLVQVGAHAMADRYTYVPLIGVFVMAVWWVADWLRDLPRGATVATTMGCAVLVACGGVTRFQAGYWRDSEKLFRHAIQVSPENSLAQHHLGLSYLTAGKFHETIEHLNESLRIEPAYPPAWFTRGMALGLTGKLDRAMSDFEQAIRLKPAYYQAYCQLGKVLALQYRLEEARTNFLEAVRLKPDYAEAQALLGNVLQLQGKVDEAIPHLRAAVVAQADYADGHYYLATALARQGQLREAAAQFEAALQLHHALPNALCDFAVLLAGKEDTRVRDVSRALQYAEKACGLTGYQDPRCLQAYALACAEAGRFAEATKLAQKALELATGNGNAELAAALREQVADFQQGLPFREKPR